MDNVERKIYRPDPANMETIEWINSAATPKVWEFRRYVTICNYIMETKIGRLPFVVEELADGDKLRIDPPLKAEELGILRSELLFQMIVREVRDG